MNSRPKIVTPSIPKNTAVPSDWRISEPAPVATASGKTPRMKANEVISMGAGGSGRPLRRLLRARHKDRIFRGQANEHNEADLGEDVDRHAPESVGGIRCPVAGPSDSRVT